MLWQSLCAATLLLLMEQWLGSTAQVNLKERGYNKFATKFNPFKMLTENSARKDNLVIKNEVGFHFKYSMQVLEDEVFLFKDVNIQPLVYNIQLFGTVAAKLNAHCKKLQDINIDGVSTFSLVNGTKFALLSSNFYSHTEARAACENKGWHLPEIYSDAEMKELKNFLAKVNVQSCHAGVENIVWEHTKRYISTGLLVENTDRLHSKRVYHVQTPTVAVDQIRTGNIRINSKKEKQYLRTGQINTWWNSILIYTEEGHMAYMEYDTAMSYPDKYEKFYDSVMSLPVAPVVCQRDITRPPLGTTYYPDGIAKFRYKTRHQGKRAAKDDQLTLDNIALDDVKWAYQLNPKLVRRCQTVGRLIGQKRASLSSRLTVALAKANIPLVSPIQQTTDESQLRQHWLDFVQLSEKDFVNEDMQNDTPHSGPPPDVQNDMPIPNSTYTDQFMPLYRDKRFIGSLVPLAFGAMNIVSNLGRMIKARRHEKRQDAQLAFLNVTQRNAEDQRQQHALQLSKLTLYQSEIMNITKGIVGSVQYLTDDSNRGNSQRNQMLILDNIESYAQQNDDISRFNMMQFEDIVDHCALRTTSMHALTEEDLQDAVNTVATQSDSLLKTDQSNMISAIMVDPTSKYNLILITKCIAVSREVYTATEMVAMPYYAGNRKYRKVLPYRYVAINTNMDTYFQMSESQFLSCRFGSCTRQDAEMDLFDNVDVCGASLFAAPNSKACQTELMSDNEPFFKVMYPDGVLYSIQQPKYVYLSCTVGENAPGNKLNQLKGMGTLYLPPGCDMKFKKLTLKGPPLINILRAQGSALYTAEMPRLRAIESHMPTITVSNLIKIGKDVINSMDTRIYKVSDDLLGAKHAVVIGLSLTGLALGCISALTIVCILYSRKYKRKFTRAFDGLDRVAQKFHSRPTTPPPPMPNMDLHGRYQQLSQIDCETAMHEYAQIKPKVPPRGKQVAFSLPSTPKINRMQLVDAHNTAALQQQLDVLHTQLEEMRRATADAEAKSGSNFTGLPGGFSKSTYYKGPCMATDTSVTPQESDDEDPTPSYP